MGQKDKFKNLVGQKFNHLTVLRLIGTNKNRAREWECICDCPAKTITKATTGVLVNGGKKSCGCIKDTTSYQNGVKHGQYGSTEYHTWQNMKARCYKKYHIKYPKYGALGIFVCSRLKDDFKAFLDYMGLKPTKAHTIDRYPDKEANYTCGECSECIANGWVKNVRWATKKEQSANLVNNVYHAYGNERMIQAEWARKFKIKANSLSWYLKNHTFEQAYHHYMNKLK